MNRAVTFAALAAAALSLSACPPIAGVFDLSGLPDGAYGVEYSGSVAIQEYDGPASYTLIDGNLPPGLEFNEAGTVTGTPEYAGLVTLTVLASNMKRVEDFQETVSFNISAEGVDGAFIGYVHDQYTNMTEESAMAPTGPQRMREMWVRVAGVGEAGMSEYTIQPGIYLPGPNGLPEKGQDDQMIAGQYDDVRIGDLEFADLEIEFFGWDPTYEDYVGGGYPSQHIPEDDPPSVTNDGVIKAGADSGGANIRLIHPVFGTVESQVHVVPPDWCPKGEHPLGGPGDDGFCA